MSYADRHLMEADRTKHYIFATASGVGMALMARHFVQEVVDVARGEGNIATAVASGAASLALGELTRRQFLIGSDLSDLISEDYTYNP